MPKPVTNVFTEFEFNEREWFAATRFSVENLMLLQTLIARAAKDKLDLKLDMQDPNVDKEKAIILFAQREAEIKGTLDAYEYLLTLSQTQAPVEEKANQVHQPATSNSQPERK